MVQMIAGQWEGCSGQRQAYNFRKKGEYSLPQQHPKQAAELRAAAVWSRNGQAQSTHPLLLFILFREFWLQSMLLLKIVHPGQCNSWNLFKKVNSECFLYYLRMICTDGKNWVCLDWLIFCSVASWRRINLFFSQIVCKAQGIIWSPYGFYFPASCCIFFTGVCF